jgi:hypothetical protein
VRFTKNASFCLTILHLSAFSVQVGQYLVQANNADLYIISKAQHAPTNWWLSDSSFSSYSSVLFML